MKLLCPQCGRPGNLPDRLSSGAYQVRCRRCNARFAAVSLALAETLPREDDRPVLVPTHGSRAVNDFARFPAHPLFRSLYEDDSSEIVRGPGDSNAEWSFNVGAFVDHDSQVDVPAFVAPQPEPTQIQPANMTSASRVGSLELGGARSEEPKRIPAASGGDVLAAKPIPNIGGSRRFVGIWSRYHLFTTIGFAALAFLVLGFFLLKTFTGGQALDPATSTLVVGLLGTAAFALLSLTGFVLHVVLIELACDLRRLRDDLECRGLPHG